jgi:hypothetical protein
MMTSIQISVIQISAYGARDTRDCFTPPILHRVNAKRNRNTPLFKPVDKSVENVYNSLLNYSPKAATGGVIFCRTA